MHDISPFWKRWVGRPITEEGCLIAHFIGEDVLEVGERYLTERVDGEEIVSDIFSSGLLLLFDR